VNQPGVVAAALEHLLDPFVLASLALAHELDLEARLLGELLGVAPQLLTKRLSEPWIVEDADVVCLEVRGHAGGVTQARQYSRDDHPVPARQHPRDLVLAAFDQ
jgi:hypothetical protein